MSIRKSRIHLKGAFFAAIIFFPALSQASTWADMWLRADQQAAHLLNKGQPKEAAKKFQDPAWRAVAEYRAGDYDAALKDFSRFNTADSNYNRGNTLAQLGQYQDALAAYDESLKQDPKNADAQYNRTIIEKLLQQPQQQDQSSQKNSSKNKNSNDKSNNNKNQKSPSSDQKNQLDSSQNNSKPDSQPKNNQSQPSKDNSQSNQNNQKQSDPAKNPSDQTQKQDANPQPAKQEATASQNPQQEQAMQQWLQSIPDDPGGLLRQKFLRDHQQKMAQAGG